MTFLKVTYETTSDHFLRCLGRTIRPLTIYFPFYFVNKTDKPLIYHLLLFKEKFLDKVDYVLHYLNFIVVKHRGIFYLSRPVTRSYRRFLLSSVGLQFTEDCLFVGVEISIERFLLVGIGVVPFEGRERWSNIFYFSFFIIRYSTVLVVLNLNPFEMFCY